MFDPDKDHRLDHGLARLAVAIASFFALVFVCVGIYLLAKGARRVSPCRSTPGIWLLRPAVPGTKLAWSAYEGAMRMISPELVQRFETDLAAARNIHNTHQPTADTARPESLMKKLEELCQEQVDIVFQLGDEPSVEDKTFQHFIQLLHDCDSFISTVKDRGDLLDIDDEAIALYQSHAQDRIKRLTLTLEERRRNRAFLRQHGFGSPARMLKGLARGAGCR